MYTDVDLRIQHFIMYKQKRQGKIARPLQVTIKVGSRTLFQIDTDFKSRCKQLNDLIYA